ncbi:hypothetical protein RI367_005946 [Sorochytrium milnesiophthora]
MSDSQQQQAQRNAVIARARQQLQNQQLSSLPLMRLMLVALPGPVAHTIASVTGASGFDALHFLLLELSVIALFRSFLGLPDPSRALLNPRRDASVPLTSAATVPPTPPLASSGPHVASTTTQTPGPPTNASMAEVAQFGQRPPVAATATAVQTSPTLPPQAIATAPSPAPQIIAIVERAAGEDEEIALSDGEEDDGDLESVQELEDHEYVQVCEELVKRFFRLAEVEHRSAPSSEWTLIVDRPPHVQIWKSVHSEHRYRILGIIDADMHTTFEFLNDILRRPEWDEMTEATRIVSTLSQTTRIQHIKIKAIWPTSARDLLLLSHWRPVDENRMIACTMSVEHPDMPLQDGVVRMAADCAGQLIERVVVDGREKSRVTQLVDGDPKGWVPKSILNMVATKALPNSFIKVNRLISALPARAQPHPSLLAVAKRHKKSRSRRNKAAAASAAAPAGVTTEQVTVTSNVSTVVGSDHNVKLLKEETLSTQTTTTTTTASAAAATAAAVATAAPAAVSAETQLVDRHSLPKSLFWMLHSALKAASPFFVAGVFFIMVWNKIKRR